jgi:hypothetical protein
MRCTDPGLHDGEACSEVVHGSRRAIRQRGLRAGGGEGDVRGHQEHPVIPPRLPATGGAHRGDSQTPRSRFENVIVSMVLCSISQRLLPLNRCRCSGCHRFLAAVATALCCSGCHRYSHCLLQRSPPLCVAAVATASCLCLCVCVSVCVSVCHLEQHITLALFAFTARALHLLGQVHTALPHCLLLGCHRFVLQRLPPHFLIACCSVATALCCSGCTCSGKSSQWPPR